MAHPYKPGDVLRWDGAGYHGCAFTAVVADRRRADGSVPLSHWKYDHETDWTANPAGHASQWRAARLLTGEEADAVHAAFAAAVLLGEVDYIE